MKKSLILIIMTILLLIFTVTSCSNSSDSGSGTTDENSNPENDDNEGKTSPYIGKKTPTEAKAVGDIVFKDGSATPYKAGMTFSDSQKASAIALIFYKGTGLNSPKNGFPDDTTSRTLGVGLKQKHNGIAWLRWVYDNDCSDAYDKNITTIQCTPSGTWGVVTFTGDRNGSDNFEQIEAFEGVDDTASETNYPLFYFAKNYKDVTGSNVKGTDYETGWYIPSIAELYQIYANGKGANKVFDIDTASKNLGGDKFEDSYYWSSSQYVPFDTAAYFFLFYYGNCGYAGGKQEDSYYVCCIREFN